MTLLIRAVTGYVTALFSKKSFLGGGVNKMEQTKKWQIEYPGFGEGCIFESLKINFLDFLGH